MVDRVIVLGGGSAGFLAAIALKSKLPDVAVSVIRSKDIGIIGVGEGSTIGLTNFLHNYLGIRPKRFFDVARPTWKLGLKFFWGPRPHFFYTFTPVLDRHNAGLPKTDGFYCEPEMENCDRISALMASDRVFERSAGGGPLIHGAIAYHFENEKFVRFLEEYAAASGIAIRDDTVIEVKQDEAGIAGLVLASGQTQSADLYVDCSGFASALLGKTLGEPFLSYASSLYCDRAVVGGWDRTAEPIKPYTTCETMDSGWCWQIEHETRINRGYVYSSSFISDEQAEAEFRSKNPKVGPARVVRFISGRYRRSWIGNVVAIGNASGFVEPLEATALGVIGVQSSLLADTLMDADREVRPTQIAFFNRHHAEYWDSIRDFLAVHYRFNTRAYTPFWDHCRRDTELGGAELVVDYYRENGPSALPGSALLRPHDQFGMRGYYALLVGQKVTYRQTYVPSAAEWQRWELMREKHRLAAMQAMTVAEALGTIHSPNWRWQSPQESRPGRT